jgi:nucleoside-diphosphate-sugar epimerase
MRICVTGASGFIVSALISTFLRENLDVSGVFRSCPSNQNFGFECHEVLDINAITKWDKVLRGVNTVVHCAAISTSKLKTNSSELQTIRSVNVEGTVNLAFQAASAGVQRFIFLSSIKVHGETTKIDTPFKNDDALRPHSIYAVSKLDAEIGLQEICDKTGMEFVIIRPPLVYGPNVGGNFAMLAKFVKYGIPLPLLSVKNQRSMIGIDNLVDLVSRCIKHPKASNQVLLAADDQDLSTADLIRFMAQAMDKPTKLFSCPPDFLVNTAKIFGRKEIAERLLGSLQVDICKTKTQLEWKPPFSVEEGLSRYIQKL